MNAASSDPKTAGAPPDDPNSVLLGRVWRPELSGPSVVTLRDGQILDITSRRAPTVRDVCELEDPTAYVTGAEGQAIGSWQEVFANSDEAKRDHSKPWMLAPVDLQSVKASGVTFVVSLLERVIEEQARGAPEKAKEVRAAITDLIGHDLSALEPGSKEAMAVKAALIEKGVWSQYLEVGIGPDAEVFTKGQPMSSVGPGAFIGIHPISNWNNPEPEIAVVVASSGRIVGATLGNDVNLRDVEGRSALLLGKAKDNNASCSLGPFIRLFDDGFDLDSVRKADVGLTVIGEEGFEIEGLSSMSEISRSPEELVATTIGPHHQYPDGFVLLLGTMFVPAMDRDVEGEGFTHKQGDLVTISSDGLGALTNRVQLCTDCEPWIFGVSHLMRDLAKRGLL